MTTVALIITTHFESLDGSPVSQDNLDLLKLWKESWELRGFECILTDGDYINKHIAKYPIVKKFIESVELLPSVNKKGFDRVSFIRWAAAYILACETNKPICISESDVINYSLFPSDLDSLDTNMFNIADTDGCPAFVYTTRKQLYHLLLSIINHKLTKYDHHNGVPHISDQNFIRMYFIKDPIYKSMSYFLGSVFNTTGWETMKLVHYGSPFFHKIGIRLTAKSKADYISELRNVV
jgi:hypothetical protein